jgi:hypothetical protein
MTVLAYSRFTEIRNDSLHTGKPYSDSPLNLYWLGNQTAFKAQTRLLEY